MSLSAPATVTVSLGGSAQGFVLGAALLPFGLLLGGSRRRRRALVVGLALVGLACGGSSKSTASQVVTLTARSGASVVTTSITVK